MYFLLSEVLFKKSFVCVWCVYVWVQAHMYGQLWALVFNFYLVWSRVSLVLMLHMPDYLAQEFPGFPCLHLPSCCWSWRYRGMLLCLVDIGSGIGTQVTCTAGTLLTPRPFIFNLYIYSAVFLEDSRCDLEYFQFIESCFVAWYMACSREL